MCFSLGRLLGRLVSVLMYRDVCQANKKILKIHRAQIPPVLALWHREQSGTSFNMRIRFVLFPFN